jgi:hypothetical protein
VPASPAAVPELHACLGACQVRCRRPAGGQAWARERPGRLTALPPTNGETLAPAVPGPRAPRGPAVLTQRPWAAAARTRPRVAKLIAAAPLRAGVVGLDDPGFPQQGKRSGGWRARTRAPWGRSALGRAPCPGATPSPRRGGPWRAGGGPQRGVVAAADAGDNPPVLLGWAARQARDGVGGRADGRGRPPRQATRPWRRGAPRRPAVARWQWRPLRGRPGPHGGRRHKCGAGRGGRGTPEGHRPVGWRLGARAPRGPPAARQDDWRTRPAAAPGDAGAGSAPRRSAVAPGPEAATGEGGGAQDQGRPWPGCHRQAVTVLRAASVLVWWARRHRRGPRGRGRPRDPCSPAPGPTAAAAAGDPSRGRPVAPPPSGPGVGHNGSGHRPLLTTILTKQY